MSMKRTGWRGVFRAIKAAMAGRLRTATIWQGRFKVIDPNSREVVAYNDILSGGISFTMELWNGDTSETFAELVLEDSSNNVIATETITTSYSLDQTSPPIGLFESTALFSSSQVSSPVEFVVLKTSGNREVARASLSLASGNAYEVKREDYIGEAESVT